MCEKSRLETKALDPQLGEEVHHSYKTFQFISKPKAWIVHKRWMECHSGWKLSKKSLNVPKVHIILSKNSFRYKSNIESKSGFLAWKRTPIITYLGDLLSTKDLWVNPRAWIIDPLLPSWCFDPKSFQTAILTARVNFPMICRTWSHYGNEKEVNY